MTRAWRRRIARCIAGGSHPAPRTGDVVRIGDRPGVLEGDWQDAVCEAGGYIVLKAADGELVTIAGYVLALLRAAGHLHVIGHHLDDSEPVS